MYLLEKDLNNVFMTFLKRLQKLKQEAAENETGIAGKARWDQANRQQKPGLVWRNRKKISQIRQQKPGWFGEIERKLAKLDSKNLVWFGEVERKLAKLSKTTFTYRSSS